MNTEYAVKTFLEQVKRLERLPLITDSEMRTLFGEEVAEVLDRLNRDNGEKQICQHCDNRCCQTINCEFHAPKFDQCPIHDYRPVVCRIHFCYRFDTGDNSIMEDLSNIFFDSLVAADRDGIPQVRLFDSPPLSRCAPELIAATSDWMNAVRDDKLDHIEAGRLISKEASKYGAIIACEEPLC